MPGSRIGHLPDGIHRLAAMAQRGESPSTLRHALAEELLTVLGADHVHIVELDDEQRPVRAVSVTGVDRAEEHALSAAVPASAVAWVAATGKSAVVSDARRPETLPAELVSHYTLLTALLLPVTATEETRTVAIVGSAEHRAWPRSEVIAAAALADVLATGLALHASRLDASIDHLTGCLNHGAMIARIEEEIDRASRQGTALAVLLIDLDDFKSVNDIHGHVTGDQLLREVGAALTREYRSFDQVARYGGDEFLVVLPNVRGPRTDLAASRALRLMRNVRFERPDGEEEGITVSVGVAEWYEGESTTDLLKKASAAMRSGKAQGKDRVGRFDRDTAPAQSTD
ncbi:MAG TPA: GGDEF domain-containing protein [Baekduia sp.]|nr:GGDEF domain-containing protein [Baekduia sp.]